ASRPHGAPAASRSASTPDCPGAAVASKAATKLRQVARSTPGHVACTTGSARATCSPVRPTMSKRLGVTLLAGLGPALALPGPPGRAGDAAKPAREVALLGEAGLERHLRQRHVGLDQQPLCAADARLELPAMRRHAGRRLEGAAEMRLRQPGHRREIAQL